MVEAVKTRWEDLSWWDRGNMNEEDDFDDCNVNGCWNFNAIFSGNCLKVVFFWGVFGSLKLKGKEEKEMDEERTISTRKPKKVQTVEYQNLDFETNIITI